MTRDDLEALSRAAEPGLRAWPVADTGNPEAAELARVLIQDLLRRYGEMDLGYLCKVDVKAFLDELVDAANQILWWSQAMRGRLTYDPHRHQKGRNLLLKDPED